MTQSCCRWKTTALVCVTALMAPHPLLPAAATAPPPGDARGADTGPRSRRGFDLAVLFQDIAANLNYNPLTPGVPGEQIASLSPLGIAPALPGFHLFANCAGREGEGEEIQKVNCESNTAAPRAQHSNQAIKQ